MKLADGGQAKVDKGMLFGMEPHWVMNGWFEISSKVGLFVGSKFKILVIKFFALSEIGTWSGNE